MGRLCDVAIPELRRLYVRNFFDLVEQLFSEVISTFSPKLARYTNVFTTALIYASVAGNGLLYSAVASTAIVVVSWARRVACKM